MLPDTDDVTDEFISLEKREYAKEGKEHVKFQGNLRPNTGGNPTKETTTTSSKLSFVAPGVSALIRQIINMDAVVLTQTLNVHPNLLMLHDALMGSPEHMSQVSADYGSQFLRYNRDHSILEKSYNQMIKVLDIFSTIELAHSSNELYYWIEEHGHINKYKKAEDIKTLDELTKEIEQIVNIVKEKRQILYSQISEQGMTIEQLYMPRPEAEDLINEGVSPESKTSTATQVFEKTHIDPAIKERLQKKKEELQQTKTDEWYILDPRLLTPDVFNMLRNMKGWYVGNNNEVFIAKSGQWYAIHMGKGYLPFPLTDAVVLKPDGSARMKPVSGFVLKALTKSEAIEVAQGIFAIAAKHNINLVNVETLPGSVLKDINHILTNIASRRYYEKKVKAAQTAIDKNQDPKKLAKLQENLSKAQIQLDKYIPILPSKDKISPHLPKATPKVKPQAKPQAKRKDPVNPWTELMNRLTAVEKKNLLGYMKQPINPYTQKEILNLINNPEDLDNAIDTLAHNVSNTEDGYDYESEANLSFLNDLKSIQQRFQSGLLSEDAAALSQEQKEIIEKEIKNKLFSIADVPRDPINPEKDLGDITKGNFRSLFNKFKEFSQGFYSSQESMDSHTDILNKVLGILDDGISEVGGIKLSLEQINGVTQGEYDIASNAIRVSLSNNAPFSNNSQSPQEVYVHELLHGTTFLAIRENPLVAARLEKIYDYIEDSLNKKRSEGGYGEGQGYKVFLDGIEKPSTNDITMAKKQYDYLFKGKEKNKLHEFLAYAVTNQKMVQYLKNKPVPKRADILGKLLDLVMIVVNTIRKVFGQKTYENTDGTALTEMMAAMEHLVALQAKHESKYEYVRNKIYGGIDKSDKFIQQLGHDAFMKFGGPPDQMPGKLTRVGQLFTTPLFVLFSNNPKMMMKAQIYFDKILNKTLRGIAHEVGAGAMTNQMIDQLLHVKSNLQKARQQAETFTTNWFDGNKQLGWEGIWKSVDSTDPHAMPVETKIALTDVIFKTDLSALRNKGTEFELSHAAIVNLLVDKTARKNLQNRIARTLGLAHSSNALQYTNELGFHIATRNTALTQSHQNVRTIALDYLSKDPSDEQIALLDMYATLVALNHTDSRQIDLVHQLAINEFAKDGKANGIIDLIDSHLDFKQESRSQLFNDDPNHIVKGYIVERVDNFTHITTGTKADIPRMKKLGYTEHYELTKVDPAQTHDTLFVTRTIPEVPDISGVMSTTNQRHMGTSLEEILSRDPAFHHTTGPHKGRPNLHKIQVRIDKFIAAQAHTAKNLSWDHTLHMRPVRDADNKIIDYRVMMNYQTTNEILQPQLEIQHVFAHMRSALVDRVNTIESDKKTVELLVYEQMTMMPDNPHMTWVDIMDPTTAYADRYRKMPWAIRDQIKRYALHGKFFVREDIIDKVFGYKAFDLTQLKLVQKAGPLFTRTLGVTHNIIKQTIGYGKNRVVMAMPQVVFGNMFSNIFQLLMRKIPIEFIFHKIYEGAYEYNRYNTDSKELKRLQHLISSKGLHKDKSAEGLKAARLKDRLEGNKVHRLHEAGLDNLIVEDINDAQTDGYFNKMRKLLLANQKWYGKAARQFEKSMPRQLGDAAKVLFMTKTSKPYQFARHLVQMTDFLGRYVMIEHETKVKGVPFETAKHDALNAFVLFDEALIPILEALDVVGITSFLSYWLRNARASRRLVSTNPTSVGISAIMQQTTGLPTLGNVNSSWLSGDFAPNYLQTDDLFDEANNITLFEILSDPLRNLFN